MSILSKMFTVILVVLCIAAAVATILIQRDVLNVRTALKEATQRGQEALVSRTNILTEMDAKSKVFSEQVKNLTDRLRDREEAIRRGDAKINDLTFRLSDTTKKLNEVELELTRWTGIADIYQKDWKAAKAEGEGLKAKLEDATRTYTESNRKLAEASAQRDFLLQQVKMLREQIVVLQERLAAGLTATAASGAGESDSFRPVLHGPTIKGKVLKVADNMAMATIDVGANDGVQQDMQFDIFRDGKFLAELVVTDVHAKMAVGRLQKVQNRIQEEDRVSNNLRPN